MERHSARFRVAGARYRFTHRCSSLTRLKAGACSLPASTLGEQRTRERERERGEAYRCFDWSMLPAKTTQPITVTAPRNCRVSRFTKTGEGYPFEIPPEVTIPLAPRPPPSSSPLLSLSFLLRQPPHFVPRLDFFSTLYRSSYCASWKLFRSPYFSSSFLFFFFFFM